jgi:hypothetical protein
MPSEQPELPVPISPVPRVYKYAITLTDEEFRKLQDRGDHLRFTLSVGLGVEAEIIVQRCG